VRRRILEQPTASRERTAKDKGGLKLFACYADQADKSFYTGRCFTNMVETPSRAVILLSRLG
jgi:hypothetical protein